LKYLICRFDFDKMKEINAKEVKKKFDNKENFILLDVREDNEIDIASISPHTHIPMGEIPNRFHELDKDKPHVVMCHSGVRSARVCNYLIEMGYDVVNFAGGIESWSSEIDPSVPKY